MMTKRFSRRAFLKYASFSAAGLVAAMALRPLQRAASSFITPDSLLEPDRQHIYFGPWSWQDDLDGDASWGPPIRNMPFGCFDLRSKVACATPIVSEGFGLFVYPQTIDVPGLLYL